MNCGRRSRRDRVGHREPVHRIATDARTFPKRFAEFATDHAGRTDHQDIHIVLDKQNDE